MLNSISNFGQQYIAIKTHDAESVLEELRKKLLVDICECRRKEIILNIPKSGCGFSYNQLKDTLRKISNQIKIGVFILDVDTSNDYIKYKRLYYRKLSNITY